MEKLWTKSGVRVSVWVTVRAGMYTLSQKRVSTFKLSVTLSNLVTDFQNFYTAKKRKKLATKPYDTTHLTLGMLLHYLGKLKIQFFQIFSRKKMQKNAFVH